jgi:hypothetical protein
MERPGLQRIGILNRRPRLLSIGMMLLLGGKRSVRLARVDRAREGAADRQLLASDTFTPYTLADDPPEGNDAKCGFACHTIVKAKDYVFTAYPKR